MHDTTVMLSDSKRKLRRDTQTRRYSVSDEKMLHCVLLDNNTTHILRSGANWRLI
jgi:hypothetical protein